MVKRCAWLMLCILLLSGCWDRREIEESGFVVGAAIDLAESSEEASESQQSNSSSGPPEGKQRYSVTYQIVAPSMLQQASGSGSSGAGGGQKAYTNMTSEGEAMMEIVKYMAARSNRVPYFEHLRIILFSEEVVKTDGFKEVMDFFIRYPEMRRNTKVFVVKGQARQALTAAPTDIKLPAFYIDRILGNFMKSSRVMPETQVGDIHENMLANHSFTILHMITGASDVDIVGKAVISCRDYRMVGALDGDEAEGSNLIIGKYAGGAIKVKVSDTITTFEIKENRIHIKVDTTDPAKLRFTIGIRVEGNITEALPKVDLSKQYVLDQLESSIEEEILRLTEQVVMKCQKELKTDVLGLGDYISRKHPRLWKTIKSDWESGAEYFTNSEIIIEPQASIRTTGVVNKTKGH